MLLPQLRRIRWAVRATLLLGVAASVLANILHASDNPISQAIAAWPPVALLLTVELISRVPVYRRVLAATRLAATATIAGIAAWVSYWHMAGVAARYGETGASPYLLPLSVDGLIVVAGICLVELGGRIAAMEQPGTDRTAPTSHIMVDTLPTDPATDPQPAPAPLRAPDLAPAHPAVALARSPGFTPTVTRGGGNRPPGPISGGSSARSGRTAPSQRHAASPTGASGKNRTSSSRPRRSPAETVALAARIKTEHPTITEAELAAALGISPSRWRTVRREAAERELAA